MELENDNLQHARQFAVGVTGPLAILACTAAMNGGTALTINEFGPIVTWLRGMLSSEYTMVLAMVVLVAGIWQLAHGGGWKTIGLVLGVLAVALVGPGVLTTMSTSMPTAAQMAVIEHVQQVPVAPVPVLVAL